MINKKKKEKLPKQFLLILLLNINNSVNGTILFNTKDHNICIYYNT